MNTRASKKEAVSLIRYAVQNGFARKVSTLRDSNGHPYCVTVSLQGEFKKGMLFAWASVHVTFRKNLHSRRNGVLMSSRCDYTNRKEANRGLWNARRSVNYVVETAQRFGARPQPW